MLAWLFRHESCSKATKELKAQLEELQEYSRKLERRLTDLDDSCELRFGRLFKRNARAEKEAEGGEPVDPSVTLPSQPGGQPGGAARRFAERRHKWV